MQQTIFDKTIKMLQHAEYALLLERKLELKYTTSLKNIFFNLILLFQRLILIKVKILSKGWKFFSNDFFLILFIVLLIYSILFFGFQIKQNILSNLYPLILGLTVYFVLFKAPSSFCTYNATNESITIIIGILKQYNITSQEYKIIKNLLEKFKDNIKKRMFTFKSILVLIWSCFLYFFDKTIIPKFINQSSIITQNIEITSMLGYSILIFILYGIIESYNRGIWYIIESFEFAFIEYENYLTIEEENVSK